MSINSIRNFTVLSSVSILSMMGCSPTSFTQGTATASVASTSTSTCVATSVAAITRMTKIIFVVDTSGSNVVPTNAQGTVQCNPNVSTCTPPTDPTKSFRGGAIQTFFTKYQSKTNFQWGFVTFSGTAAQSLITKSGLPSITGSTSQFQSAIQTFMGMTDNDATPYQAALQTTKQVIQNDSDLNTSAQPHYVVIFLTDGFPTDYTNSSGVFNGVAMQSDLAALLLAAPGRVTLSTVNYGQANDPNAVALLEGMAAEGKGQFARAADTSTAIQIDDLIPGTTSTCPN